MIKYISILFLAATISIPAWGQNKSGWGKAHEAAHNKELQANNKSKLDASVISIQREKEIQERESRIPGLSAESSMMIEDLLKEASTHIGKRYVLGSKGPGTFDCSGFSGYVYKQFGFTIGASSREQYKIGKPIDKKDLRKGDLVFFTSRSSGKNVGHVGIVWEVNKETGDFKFIHASLRGVRISDFEGYYVNRYVGARRIIE